MQFRRTLLRGVATIATGGVFGSVLGVGSTVAAEDPNEGASQRTRRDDADTTVVTSVDPSIQDVTGIPSAVEPFWMDLTSRYSSVTVDDIESVSGEFAIRNGSIRGGRAVLRGTFDRRALGQTLQERDAVSLQTDVTQRSDSMDRFVLSDEPSAVGVANSAILVEYGPTTEVAVARLNQSIDCGADQCTAIITETVPLELTGSMIGYATLGSGTRSRLLERFHDAPEGIDAILRHAEALGVALEADARRSTLRYGVVADPDSLSRRSLWDVTTHAVDGDDTLAIESISRHGRLLIVETTVETSGMWTTHERLFETVLEENSTQSI